MEIIASSKKTDPEHVSKILKHKATYIPYVLPVLMAVYITILNIIDSPASLTRIDPEYLCLLNGLNVSILQFDNIGYTDLPGSPFLVLTGIFIRIIHLFSGKGAIVDDVIFRPDYYIQGSSYLLILLTVIILIWGGIKIYKSTQNIFAVIVLQASLLLSPVTLSLQIRYSTDRFLSIFVFIFAVYTILYLYKSINSRKYALYSGIIIGIGFITKFNFIALTILPVFLFVSFKDWLIYGVSFLVSSFVSFLPIIDKFQNVKRFITGLAENQGTYGQGGKQMFDLEAMFHNLKEIPVLNEGFTLLIVLSLITILVLLLKRKKKTNTKKLLFLIGFLIASLIEIVMVSKHFKNYYLAPVLGLSGLVFFILWDSYFQNKKRTGIIAGGIGMLLFLIAPIKDVARHTQITKSKQAARINTVNQFNKLIDDSDYILFEPAWMSGPSKINGLIWGISYVADRNDFSDVYLKHYPNILTYEGDNRPFKHFRTKDADIERILKEENTIWLFSNPGRNTHRVLEELKRQAGYINADINTDSVFINDANKDMLIKASIACDSAKTSFRLASFFNNMENETKFWKQNALSSEESTSGDKSTKISRGNKFSSTFEINPSDTEKNIHSLEIFCKYFQSRLNTSVRLIIEASSEKGGRLWYPVYISDYISQTDQWVDFKYKIFLPEKYADANILKVYFYNTSKNQVYIDDMEVQIKYSTL